MYKYASRLYMGHNRHEVYRLVRGGFVYLQSVGKPSVIVAGVSNPFL